MISDLLNRFMNTYSANSGARVDSKSEQHKLICTSIPNELRKHPYLNRYYIKGSEGNGQRTFYPWICLMNANITRSPQKGLYIAILFQRNMKGFYIALNQGITFFKTIYKSNAYTRANEAASYYRENISGEDFSKTISLGGIKPDNGYGFEQTTVVCKHFEKNNFTDEEFINCLLEYANLYDEIIDNMDGYSYEAIIPKIVDDPNLQFEPAEKAIEEMKEAIYQGSKPNSPILIPVIPKIDKVTRFRRISTPSNKKTDYLKRAQENAQTGLLGEKRVLEYEIDRLNSIGLEQYAKKIEHVAQTNDVLGYDIKSYDIDENGKVHEIYIEVKTSSTVKDVDFFVSRNEVERSRVLKKYYFLYRLYNCSVSSTEIKFYRVKGSIEENFDLNAETYKASLKEEANIVLTNYESIKNKNQNCLYK